jgi:hypothetical protein
MNFFFLYQSDFSISIIYQLPPLEMAQQPIPIQSLSIEQLNGLKENLEEVCILLSLSCPDWHYHFPEDVYLLTEKTNLSKG